MEKFDLIVIGSGAGMNIVSNAAAQGMSVALAEHGPLGGTCLNNGCIPSKMLIYPADVIRVLQGARAVGVEGTIARIDFPLIMSRMRAVVDLGTRDLQKAIESEEKVALLRDPAEFTGDKTLRSGNRTITAPKIVIASGARAQVPPVPGLKEAGYLDNITVLNVDEPPESLIIIGAGYIGCEYGHFFSAMGTDVTIIGRSLQVLNNEDPEICRIVKKALSRDMRIYTGHEVQRVAIKNGKRCVSARNRQDGKTYDFQAQKIMVAAGRRSNSDILKPERTGVETDKQGWIKVDDYLETSNKGIWALGDAIGEHMFRHTANYEADVVWHNMTSEDKAKVDFHAVPHAIFTHPPVSGVGLKESEALAAGYKIMIGRARYTEVAKGYAMAEEDGFVKVIVQEETGRILGCSVVGSSAPELVQQVVYLMNSDRQDISPILRSQIIHPTISEILARAFAGLRRPEHLHKSEGSHQMKPISPDHCLYL